MTPSETVDAIARMAERRDLTRSAYRLAPCGGCGAPSFRRPCPLCAYHPMGDDRGTWHPDVVGLEHFRSVVDRSGDQRSGGNLATWYVRTLERGARGLARSHRQDVMEGLRPMLREAQAMVGLLSADEAFAIVSGQGQVLSRPEDDGHLQHWRILDDCRGLMGAIFEDVADPVRRTARSHDGQMRLEARMRALLATVHAGDPASAHERSEALMTEVRTLLAERRIEWTGGLASALAHMDKVVADGPLPPAP